MELNVSSQFSAPSQILNTNDNDVDGNLFMESPCLDSIDNKSTLRKDSIITVNNGGDEENAKSSEENINTDVNNFEDRGNAKSSESFINIVFKRFNLKCGELFFLILSATFILIILIYLTFIVLIPDSSNSASIENSTQKYTTTDSITLDPFTPVNSSDCNQETEYYWEGWYHAPNKSIKYICQDYQQVVIVIIQPLYNQKMGCFDSSGCYELIDKYINEAKGYAKFSFYIDKNGMVYGGRDWLCQYSGGEILVAAMVDYSDVVKGVVNWNLVLNHFNQDITTFAFNCQYFVEDVITQRLNGTMST